MACEYCTMPGKPRDGVEVCDHCWNLLQNPVTALPLIRGHITMELRQKNPQMAEPELRQMIEKFMGTLAQFRKPSPSH